MVAVVTQPATNWVHITLGTSIVNVENKIILVLLLGTFDLLSLVLSCSMVVLYIRQVVALDRWNGVCGRFKNWPL